MAAASWRKSLAPLLENPKQPFKEAAFTQVQRKTGDGHSIRTDRWRYTEWGPKGELGAELYDHQNDPHEFTNLAKDPTKAKEIQTLRQQLHAAYPATQPAAVQ